MDMCNSAELQPHKDYYGPLLTQHIKTILESGLLLDEDYEVLLKASNFKMYPIKATNPPLGLIACALTTLGSVFVAKRYNLPFVVFPPLTVSLTVLCLNKISMIKCRRRKEIVNFLVERLIKVRKLNATIIRYTKLRRELSTRKETESLLYHKDFEVFMNIFFKKYQTYFKDCLKGIQMLTLLTNELETDFESLKHIDVQLALDCSSCSYSEYPNLISRVQDIYIFLSSKFLNYLAITLCKNVNINNAPEIKFLLDKKLPCFNAILDKLYGEVQKEFNNLRYCTSKKVEIDTQNKRTLRRHVSGKLQQTLISAVNNLSIIMEKSQAVLQKVESAETENDVKKLESALSDLRDHAFATYESLDVLCKLYGIFSESNRQQDETETVNTTLNEDGSKQNVATLNHDDIIDVLEENYELFIPEKENTNLPKEPGTQMDQSGVYLNLMLKELRQSLKKHERFMAARDKRGIKDDNEEGKQENKKDINKKEVLTPKFDLNALTSQKKEQKNIQNLSSKLPPIPSPRPSKLPPPPPPQPKFDLLNTNDGMEGSSKICLLDKIKALSSQIKTKEEVFGNKECLSDSDSC